MSRSNLPPIEIGDFSHPKALHGIPERRRPDWAQRRCTACSGRGSRNEILHTDSFRCRQAHCRECGGSGWTTDAQRPLPDIVLVDGRPAWRTAVADPVHRAFVMHVVEVADENPPPAGPAMAEAA